MKFSDRSVIEVMVIIFTIVVAIGILALGSTIMIVEIRDPEIDTDKITTLLVSLLSAILGALLGLIAGRSSAKDDDLHRRQSGEMNGLGDSDK